MYSTSNQNRKEDHKLTKDSGIELTILMPCLNEARTLPTCLRKAVEFIERGQVQAEIIVADNGSVDDSVKIAEQYGARVVCVADKGYGNALYTGILNALGTYVIMGDSDASYNFLESGGILRELRDGQDLVLGNRFKGGIAAGAMPVLHRYLGNPVLSKLGSLFAGQAIGDIYCGLRGFKRDKIMSLNLQMAGMEFAVEMIMKATRAGLKVTEVPVSLSPDGRDRRPHLRTWTDGWKTLRFLLLYAPLRYFLVPGFVLMILGFVASVRLYLGPVYFGNTAFDAQTLLYTVVIFVIGFQIVFFGMGARAYSVINKLIPEDKFVQNMLRPFAPEATMWMGFLLLLMGLGGSVYALIDWQKVGYGALDFSSTLRLIIPSIASLILGAQTIVYSFFCSILTLKRREPTPIDSDCRAH